MLVISQKSRCGTASEPERGGRKGDWDQLLCVYGCVIWWNKKDVLFITHIYIHHKQWDVPRKEGVGGDEPEEAGQVVRELVGGGREVWRHGRSRRAAALGGSQAGADLGHKRVQNSGAEVRLERLGEGLLLLVVAAARGGVEEVEVPRPDVEEGLHVRCGKKSWGFVWESID
jgi:hypothetical protein